MFCVNSQLGQAFIRTNQLKRALQLLNKFEDAGQQLDSNAHLAVGFELLRLLGKPHRGKAFDDNECDSFSNMLRASTGVKMSKEDSVKKCAECFRLAVQTQALFPG